ncbi:WD repeat-containing protein 35-like [Octopus sinensis]|uniref:WD repeat-containing protein 35-like n=1 Tax=Octopus sinensis TaxID=2607531 RepID=A0A6P7TV39_9MOLL|nr:WD repeat-containing protein 35-like [Octopus sinensis]XP_029656199.1 WD repeat-containing protein 35-like [Octopus sinensis]
MTLFKNYKEAENIYLSINRKDLAINQWKLIGDYLKLQNISDETFNKNMPEINHIVGNHYADHRKWKEAIYYLEMAKDNSRIIDCYYSIQDFEGLKKYSNELSNDKNSLLKIADIFQKSGMYLQSVEIYQKLQDFDKAISVCISGNLWKYAYNLAKQSNLVDIKSLLSKNVNFLVNSGQLFEAISLCKEGGIYQEAVKFVLDFTEKYRQNCRSLTTIKKLYVLAGFLFNEQKSVINFDKKISRLELLKVWMKKIVGWQAMK